MDLHQEKIAETAHDAETPQRLRAPVWAYKLLLPERHGPVEPALDDGTCSQPEAVVDADAHTTFFLNVLADAPERAAAVFGLAQSEHR